MSKYSYLVKNIGLFALTNFALKLITFVLVPVYTYYLTATQYGITDMLLTTVNMVIPLATLSIADSTLRFCFERSESSVAYASVGFGITVLSCGIVALLLPCLNLNFFGGLGNYKGWFLACYSVMAFQIYLSNLSRGVGKIVTMAVASIIGSLVNIGLTLLTIVVLKWAMLGFFFSLMAGNLIGCFWYLIPGQLYRYIRFNPEYYKNNLKAMLKYSLPLVPNALSWWMTQNINRFFITGMIGIAASGMFAAAAKVPGFLKLVTGVFEQAWNLSAFQQFKSQNKEKFFSIIFLLYNALLVVVVALFIPISGWVSSFILQKGFYEAWVLIPFQLMSFYYSSLSAFYGSIYTSSMKTKSLFITTVIGAVICIVLNYILLHTCGLLGACLASMISNAITWLLRVYDSRKTLIVRVNLVSMIITNALLIGSAVIVSYRIGEWFLCACIIMVIVMFVQMSILIPLAKKVLKNLKDKR